MTACDGEDMLIKALTNRHPRRTDKHLNFWFFMLDLGPEETILAENTPEFVGAAALCCVSRALAACLRPFEIRCYVCQTIKACRFFSPQWGHWITSWPALRKCHCCRETGEVCFDMHHPNCYDCELEWLHASSDSSGLLMSEPPFWS